MTSSGVSRRRLRRLTTAITAAAGLAVSGTIFTGGAAFAAGFTGHIRVVTDATRSWVPIAYDCFDGSDLTPDQHSVLGPKRTPFGSGSHQFQIGTFAEQTEIYRTPRYDGTPLGDITRLAYSTYAKQTDGNGPDRQLPYLRLTVDSNGDGIYDNQVDDSLFFYPSNNQDTAANPHGIVNGRWQNWNVAEGLVNVNGDDGPSNAMTLQAYAATHQNATLINNNGGAATGGSISTVVGCGSLGNDDTFRNGTYNVDRVIVGKSGQDTLFDFETSRRDETSQPSALVTVTEQHLRGWVHRAFIDDPDYHEVTTNQRFVRGPASPPEGVGSLRFKIGSNPLRVEQFRTPKYDRRLLRDLRGLSYSTSQRPLHADGQFQYPAYLRLNIDTNGNTDGMLERDESLFFYPSNNQNTRANALTVEDGVWQAWNAYRGKWNINGDDGPSEASTLRSYLVQHPDARIVNNDNGMPSGGGLTVQVSGDGATKGAFFVDAINVRLVDKATSTQVTGKNYDLEP